MAKMPGAVWKPLGTQTESRLLKKNKIILHTMVGSLSGTDYYFREGNGRGYDGTESHFGVGGDGAIWQWQDTEWQADAQLYGNDDCISIETADKGSPFPSWSGSNVPAWTVKQIESIAQIVAWASKTHGIPLVLITNTYDSTKGVGYHRQGIEPYRQHGESYSSAFGKVCPGDRRVAQIPTIIARAKQILAGGTGGTDVPLDQTDLNNIYAVVRNVLNHPPDGKKVFGNQYVRRTVDGEVISIPTNQEVADAKTYAMAAVQKIAALEATVVALAGGSTDVEAIKDAAAAGAQEAIVDVQTRLDSQLTKIEALVALVQELGESAGLDAQEVADELARRLAA